MLTLISISRNTPTDGETLLVFGMYEPIIIPAVLDKDNNIVTPEQKVYKQLKNVLLRAGDHSVDESDSALESKARISLEPKEEAPVDLDN